MGTEAQLVSITTFTDVTEDGIMPGDWGDTGILCEIGPVTGTGSEGGSGAADGVETVTVIKGDGARTAVVAAVTSGCAKGEPGECPRPGVSLAFDTMLNSGAFKGGAGTAWPSNVSMVSSGSEGRGVVTRVLRNALTDIDAFGAEFASVVEFWVITEEGMGVGRDVGRGEAGTSNCMLPPTRPGGGGDNTWFVSSSWGGDWNNEKQQLTYATLEKW
jgi:hypothetical protein